LAKELGGTHIVTRFFQDYQAEQKNNKHADKKDSIDRIESIVGTFDITMLPATARLQEIKTTYPLFTTSDVRLGSIMVKEDIEKWCGYIKLVDQSGEQ
jgi:hypothetical protein